MTKQEKTQYLNTKSVAYYSGYNGIEIKAIEYDTDDYIIFTVNTWYSSTLNPVTVHRSKVYYNANGENYFKYNGCRIKLNECIRI